MRPGFESASQFVPLASSCLQSTAKKLFIFDAVYLRRNNVVFKQATFPPCAATAAGEIKERCLIGNMSYCGRTAVGSSVIFQSSHQRSDGENQQAKAKTCSADTPDCTLSLGHRFSLSVCAHFICARRFCALSRREFGTSANQAAGG